MATPRYSIARDFLTGNGTGGMRLALRGEIDLAAHDVLLTEITRAVKGPATSVEVDLDGVSFVDSGGVGVLVSGYHRALESGCGYRIVNARGMVRQVLEITGVLATLSNGSPPQRQPQPS